MSAIITQYPLDSIVAQLAQRGKNVRLKQTGDKQITAHYLVDMQFDLMRHDDTSLYLAYRLNWAATVVANALLSKVKTVKLSIDTRAQTVQVHLNQFGQLKPMFKKHRLHQVYLRDNVVYLEWLNLPEAA